jgi:hypothetical protein
MQMGYVRHGTTLCIPPDTGTVTLTSVSCSGLKVPNRIGEPLPGAIGTEQARKGFHRG